MCKATSCKPMGSEDWNVCGSKMGTSKGAWVWDVMPRKMGSDEAGDEVGTIGILFLLVALLLLSPQAGGHIERVPST